MSEFTCIAILPLQVFRFSVWEGRPLPGMALMNLRYRNEAAVGPAARPAVTTSSSSSSSHAVCPGGGRSGVEGPGLSAAQRVLYCLGAVALRYGWARLGHHAAAQHWGDASSLGVGGWRRRAWGLMRQAESAYRLASLANFLAFLRSGRYRQEQCRVDVADVAAMQVQLCMCCWACNLAVCPCLPPAAGLTCLLSTAGQMTLPTGAGACWSACYGRGWCTSSHRRPVPSALST